MGNFEVGLKLALARIAEGEATAKLDASRSPGEFVAALRAEALAEALGELMAVVEYRKAQYAIAGVLDATAAVERRLTSIADELAALRAEVVELKGRPDTFKDPFTGKPSWREERRRHLSDQQAALLRQQKEALAEQSYLRTVLPMLQAIQKPADLPALRWVLAAMAGQVQADGSDMLYLATADAGGR